jgi:hypothetical protein
LDRLLTKPILILPTTNDISRCAPPAFAHSPCRTPRRRPARAGAVEPASGTPPGSGAVGGRRTAGRPPDGWAGCSSDRWRRRPDRRTGSAGGPPWPNRRRFAPNRCPPETIRNFLNSRICFSNFLTCKPHCK